jgi:hypothetical protein
VSDVQGDALQVEGTACVGRTVTLVTTPAVPPIYLLPHTFDVTQACHELENPAVWNLHGQRKAQYAHVAMSDVWVRYNAIENYSDLATFNEPHESVWYPEAGELPAVVDLVFQVMTAVRGERLGGVLITKIPAGGSVAPHVDGGWHARYYDKFAVQLMGTAEQGFCFEGYRLSALAGELYTFDNAQTHWVENPTTEDRCTLIICIHGHD